MAGLPRYPIGSGSAMSGVDLSPWLRSAQMETQRQVANANLQQQAQAAATALRQRQIERRISQEQFDAEMQRGNEAAAQRKRQASEELGLRRQEGAERKRQASEQMGFAREQLTSKERALAEETAEDERRKKATEELLGFKNRIREIVPGIVQDIRAAEPDISPEEIRDRLIVSAQDSNLTPEEKQIQLDEVDQWYNTEAKLEQQRASREERKTTRAETKARQQEADAAKKQQQADIAESRTLDNFNKDPQARQLAHAIATLQRERVSLQTRVRYFEDSAGESESTQAMVTRLKASLAGVDDDIAVNKAAQQQLWESYRDRQRDEQPPDDQSAALPVAPSILDKISRPRS